MTTYGSKIRKRREELGLTQSDLGARLNISKQAVHQYESGHRVPRMGTMENIAKKLNTTVIGLLSIE